MEGIDKANLKEITSRYAFTLAGYVIEGIISYDSAMATMVSLEQDPEELVKAMEDVYKLIEPNIIYGEL